MINFTKYILTSLSESITRYPERNAFYIDGTYYTYAQLAERISAIRGVIRKTEKNEQIWGLALHDDLNTYASIFALWMEGKAYVPLHPSWPADRIESIKVQVGCSNVLDACDAPYTEDLLDDWAEASEDDLAYILFTSGSTGVPKGVQITRRNIAAFMDSFWQTGINITPEDRCMQVFDLTFDVSVQSYLVALTRGACVYTVPYGQVKYLYAASLIQEQHITFGAMAPSMLTYLRPYFEEFDAHFSANFVIYIKPANLQGIYFVKIRKTSDFKMKNNTCFKLLTQIDQDFNRIFSDFIILDTNDKNQIKYFYNLIEMMFNYSFLEEQISQ